MAKRNTYTGATDLKKWQETNCDMCRRKDCYVKTRVESGQITNRNARYIGCNGNKLKNKCNNFNIPNSKKYRNNKDRCIAESFLLNMY